VKTAAADYVLKRERPAPGESVSEFRLLRNNRVGIVRVSHGGIPFSDPASDVYLLTAPILGHPYVECGFAGFELKQRTYPGDFVLQHLKDGVSGFAEGDVTVQMTVLDGPWFRSLLQEAHNERAADLAPLSLRTWRSGFLEGLIGRLWTRLGTDGDAGQAWADSAAVLVAHTLAEQVGQAPPRRPERRPLSPVQMNRVHSFVEAHLAEPVGLVEMAAAAGLSVYHFARRFKATRGETPHQFLTLRRLDRARRLIARGDLPLSAIAFAVGFSSQSHMTTAFRRHFGRTPGWFKENGP
jgi:AraC-like DNA-binding protein